MVFKYTEHLDTYKQTNNKTVDTLISWLVVTTETDIAEMLVRRDWEAPCGKDSCSNGCAPLGKICMCRNG